MSNSKKSSRRWLGGAALVLLALAIWWANRPALSSAPVTETKTVVASSATVSPVPSISVNKTVEEKSAAAVAGAPYASAPSATVATPPAALVAAPAVAAAQPAVSNAPLGSLASVNPDAPKSEIEASARMYAAHAPLRVPEVADPDSASNKEILNTMVTKLITQPPRNPPAVEPTKS